MTLRSRFFLILGLLCASVTAASAVTTFKDNFTSTKLNSKWKHVSENKGKLTPKNGKLNLVTSSKSKDTGGHLILTKPLPKVTENWEMQLTLENKAKSGEAWVGAAIANSAKPYDNMCGVELYQQKGKRWIDTFHIQKGKESDGPAKSTTAKKVYVRLVYKKSTKLITLYRRTSTSASWTKVLTYSPFNDKKQKYRGNWGLDKKKGKFIVAIYAGSKKVKVTAGTVTADGFVVKN